MPVFTEALHQRDRLDLGELLEAPAALLAPETAVLETPERAAAVEHSTRGQRPAWTRTVARIRAGISRTTATALDDYCPGRIWRATLKPRAALRVMTTPASPKSESLAIRIASS